jgi:hypothetical protein
VKSRRQGLHVYIDWPLYIPVISTMVRRGLFPILNGVDRHYVEVLRRGKLEERFGANYHDDSDGSGEFRPVFRTSAVQDYARERRSVAHAKEDLKGREEVAFGGYPIKQFSHLSRALIWLNLDTSW